MRDKQSRERYWEKLLRKYRFVIMTDNDFEEKISLKLSRFNIFALVGFLVFFCFFVTLLLIVLTPLNEYVPGKSSSEVHEKLITLSLRSDSLERALINSKVYLENINNIISGNKLITPNETIEKNYDQNIVFENSKIDSLFRLSVEAEERGSILIESTSSNNYLLFYTPVSGMVSDKYNLKTKHFGIDLVAKDKSRISSVLDGTVIINQWTFETGYVIVIQHEDGYVSIYKHNSLILKDVGDFVNAGDHIAIIGNSGEFSTGPHLHFELWRKGSPLNPENYINF
tara:strand:- start:890 stop:1741 length:852 start_codon:yes stop_codon:yes gene_type:complete